MEMALYLDAFEKALLQYEVQKAYEILEDFTAVYPAIDFIDKVLLESMIRIGDKWENGEVALSQVYMSSKLCERISDGLLPSANLSIKPSPKMAIAVINDHHVLGKKIVKSMIQASGYQLTDLGYGLGVDELFEAVKSQGIRILILSVLMYPSALEIKKLVRLFREAQLKVKVLVGGAPFLMDPELWREVGADAMGRHAADDIPLIEAWIKEAFDHEVL